MIAGGEELLRVGVTPAPCETIPALVILAASSAASSSMTFWASLLEGGASTLTFSDCFFFLLDALPMRDESRQED